MSEVFACFRSPSAVAVGSVSACCSQRTVAGSSDADRHHLANRPRRWTSGPSHQALSKHTHYPRHHCAQNADHLAYKTPLSAFFTEVVCTVGTTPVQEAASSPPNGGNCIIRGATRRRHAGSQLLMLQNPHCCRCREQRRGRRARPRCPWAAAGHTYQAPPDWRPPRGLRGLAGLRDDAPSEARSADGERAGRPRGGRRSGGATRRLGGATSSAITVARHSKRGRHQPTPCASALTHP